MVLKINKEYSGFKLLRQEEVKDINSTALIFEHVKSGARLFKLQNDDDNKVFSIGFRTPPENSMGIPHIIEHSVLCGSRKFPVKDPFVELMKGSLNTFLNAMTFPDKTMYPVASKNEKDFFNLMDVYLDSVLYPDLHNTPEILMQEGWHYELNDPNGEIEYKGVVYNEMQGAFSYPEAIISRKVEESLFPDTPYYFESGGDPNVIPQLTQEQFSAFHKKYYHPSNSYIFLYGNEDIEKELKFIDENYLKDFDRINVDSSIPSQKPFTKMNEMEIKYPIAQDEDDKDKTFFGLNFVTGEAVDRELYYAMDILSYILIGTPASPLKKALIDAGLGKDVYGEFVNSIKQPTFSVVVKNSNIDQKERFKKVFYDTLQSLVKDGIDKKLIEASINIYEFKLREADFEGLPKGLLYGIRCMDSWLYDGDPVMHLKYDETFKKIREGAKNRYFEDLIEKYFINNTHASLITLIPQKGLLEEKTAKTKEKLKNYKASLSKDEINALVANTQNLKKRQSTPETKEDIEKIPLLKLEDINKQAEVIPSEIKKINNTEVLFQDIFTNGIVYLNILFNTKGVKQQDLMYIPLLADVLTKVSTKNLTYEELSKQININTGGIRFEVEVFEEKGKPDAYLPKLTLKSRALTGSIPELIDLIDEIVNSSKFDDKKRLREIIRENRSQFEMILFDAGHSVAAKRLMSFYSITGRYVEELTGISYYKFLSNLEKNFDSMADSIVEGLKKVSKSIFNLNNVLVSVTSSKEDYPKAEEGLKEFLDTLNSEQLSYYEYSFDFPVKSEGLLTQGNVQYAAMGYNFIKLGYSYSGKMKVLKKILASDFLWNRIRVLGGAYGCMANMDNSGNVCLVSYRDPNLKETLDVYRDTANYLAAFNVSEREMTKYIIGTVSDLDYPLTPAMKGERATAYYLKKTTQEDVQKERDEVLSTTPQDISSFKDLLNDVMKQNYICVLGNEEKIKKNSNIFDRLTKVFE
ncbi:MAG TPA: peptidase M16 [Clostridiaceae bacterium]|nr:peptidase M16 [Clostridiaceae bacterium]HBF77144.1 peptidase M16 [Clostridiaceae bacterium]HBG38127.1 peptidase M16 [Clostridiaceae bacterium]HBN28300.1 peptidase M16 [Clostridiaceae bacterium]HBX48166.1 peptidase M16 [Clostridiaceae bacterium]